MFLNIKLQRIRNFIFIVHNIIKGFTEYGTNLGTQWTRLEILDGLNLLTLRWHYIENRHDSVVTSMHGLRNTTQKNPSPQFITDTWEVTVVNQVQKGCFLLCAWADIRWSKGKVGKLSCGRTNLDYFLECHHKCKVLRVKEERGHPVCCQCSVQKLQSG